jgi:hypothetical protein
MFPDVCEALSLGHLARGDATSAMVASEWYMRNNHFPGWGRPYEFASELFQKVRDIEKSTWCTQQQQGLKSSMHHVVLTWCV